MGGLEFVNFRCPSSWLLDVIIGPEGPYRAKIYIGALCMLYQTSLTMDQDPKKVSNNGRRIKKLLYMYGTMAGSLDNLERLRIVKSFLNLSGTGMGGGQALKRIPRIKFPQRHPKSSPSPFASASGTQASSSASDADLSFFSSSKASAAVGGKASLQPKRTPVSKEEIEAILLGGCF